MGNFGFIVETDHKPLENFHKEQISNKRVTNWLFKLQYILPQIIANKYRTDANTAATNYISPHFPSFEPINTSSAVVNELHDDWPT
ncbi:unnamed protein product, partial [Rotaria sp. Silwood1]